MTTRERVAELEIEHLLDAEIDALDLAATWRELARAALGKLHAQHVEIERQKRTIVDLREELRRLVARRVAA